MEQNKEYLDLTSHYFFLFQVSPTKYTQFYCFFREQHLKLKVKEKTVFQVTNEKTLAAVLSNSTVHKHIFAQGEQAKMEVYGV